MNPRMMIVVDGRVEAIYVAGDMAGGVQIRSTEPDHPGVSPERVSQDFFSTLRRVPLGTPDYVKVASEAAIVGRERGMFDFHGEIRDEKKMDEVIEATIVSGRLAEERQAQGGPPEAPPENLAEIPPPGPHQPERPVIRPIEGEPDPDPSAATAFVESPITAA